jgi:hypothetical protein
MRTNVTNIAGSIDSVADAAPLVASYLRRFDQLAKRRAFWRAAGFALLYVLIWIAICCAIDRLRNLPAGTRFWLLVSGMVLAAVNVSRAAWSAGRESNWVEVAARIEDGDPRFEQSLLTVVSQFAGDPAARGSDQILYHLQREVELRLSSTPQRAAVRTAGAIAPWLCCLGLLAAAWGLRGVPRLGVGQLVERLILPYAGIGPVTTTQLAVWPGDRDVVQSQPLQIDATVDHLIGDSVFLNLNTQGDWYRVVMDSSDGAHFRYLVSSIDRDVRYFVVAGDAQSPTFLARVLRRPSVSQFRVSYEYPEYVRRAPANLTNTDGLIEAPAETRVTLTAVCTENLQSALLSIGDEKILMSRTSDPASRTATFVVTKDARCALDLISERDVAGSGPPGMRIHPLVNQPPIARLFQAGQELRLTPRDQVSLTYQAGDDYALNSLALRVRINNAPPVDLPIALLGNHRGQKGIVRLDLAQLPLKLGDKATVCTVAQDSAGQTSTSGALQIDISARPVDLDTEQRVTELQAAGALATKLIADLDAARQAIAQTDAGPDKQSSAFAAASAQANLSLANASESATLLRQCLCRTILHTRTSAQCVALCQWSDSAQMLAQTADQLFQLRGDTEGTSQPLDPQLQRSLDRAHFLADVVTKAWEAQLAAVLLAEREDLAAAKQKPSSPAIDAGLKALKIDASAMDVTSRLQSMIDAGKTLSQGAHLVDYSAAARLWADDLARGSHANPGLNRRLAAAAEAEAVRPDADLQRARDLQIASRAAATIASSFAEKEPEESTAAASATAFASALSALQQESVLRGQPAGTVPRGELKAAMIAAATARGQLISWAPEPGLPGPSVGSAGAATPQTSPAVVKRDAEDLALQASAASAERDYDRAARLDDVLNHHLKESSPIPGSVPRDPDEQLDVVQQRVAASMSEARTLDGIGQTLNAVVKRTRDAEHSQSDDLASRQREVADQIGEVVTQMEDTGDSNASEPNSRERAAAAFLAVQEQIAAMPQALSDAQSAAAAARSARERVERAQAAEARLKGRVSDEDRGMAHRATAEAISESDEATDRLEASMTSLNSARAASWADELGVYAPESTSACDGIQTQLVAALTDFDRAVHGADAQAIDRMAGGVRAAVESVERELAGAQDALTERDPLVAAGSFAGAAADSLAQSPPDVNGALEQQVRATGALARAWDQSIHDAAAQRLSIVPSLQPVFGPATPGKSMPWADSANGGGWGHLQSQEAESVNFTGHDSDPAGYEEPLRIYFQALGKAQDAHAQGH